MKLPFVKRTTYEKEIKNKKQQIYNIQQIVKELEEELKIASTVASDILPRLARISVYDIEKFTTYRVCVDLHRDMVERVFTHGGDEQIIHYFAKMLSQKIEHKMVQFNFARCERE